MNRQKFSSALIFLFLLSAVCSPQTKDKSKIALNSPPNSQSAKSSPAFAELLLRKTERESELEGLSLDYKDDFPKIKEIRFELDSLQKEMNRILAVNASDFGRLTLALGKLMVRKTELETDLWNLRQKYGDDHPEVKRAKRKIEVFEKAINEILS